MRSAYQEVDDLGKKLQFFVRILYFIPPEKQMHFKRKQALGKSAILGSVANDESKCFFKPNYPIKISIVTIALHDTSSCSHHRLP